MLTGFADDVLGSADNDYGIEVREVTLAKWALSIESFEKSHLI